MDGTLHVLFQIPQVWRDMYPFRYGVRPFYPPQSLWHRSRHTSQYSSISVKIKASKINPFRQGVTIYLGTIRTAICSVKAILTYIAVWGTDQGPLFYFSDKWLLTRERFVKEIRAALSKTQVDLDVYAGHSFRTGAATVAYTKGIKDLTILLKVRTVC